MGSAGERTDAPGNAWERMLHWAIALEDGVLAIDSAGLVAFANAMAVRMAGASRQALVGTRFFDLFQLEGAARARWETAVREGVDGSRETARLARRGGKSIEVACQVFPVDFGPITGMVVVFEDLAEKARARQEIAERDARLCALFEAAVDCIVAIDERGIIESVNPAIRSVFGYEPEEVIGRNVSMLMPAPFRDGHGEHLESYLRTGEAHVIGIGREVVGMRKDGSVFPMHLSVAEARLGNRRIFTGIMHDITERKRIEERLEERVRARTAELERSNEELQQFAHIASHDLQEPLRTVASYTQLLARRCGDLLGAEEQELIAFALDGTRRMQSLIQDLLAYARVGADAARREPARLDELLAQVLHDLQGKIEEASAEIRSSDLPEILGDRGQLVQLLQNLIGNAIKFRQDGRPCVVEISASRVDGDWTIAVQDNGIGIAAEHRERVFQVFQRLHTREEFPGSGIGLSICKKIVEGHGGRIWVESDPGEGAVFRFTLPASPDDADAGISPRHDPA